MSHYASHPFPGGRWSGACNAGVNIPRIPREKYRVQIHPALLLALLLSFSIKWLLLPLHITTSCTISSSFAMTNVVELKVGLHCDDCIKKILKAIKKIQADIETYNVDTQLNKVTVTGNVTAEQVIRVLHKIGKNATAWDQSTSN